MSTCPALVAKLQCQDEEEEKTDQGTHTNVVYQCIQWTTHLPCVGRHKKEYQTANTHTYVTPISLLRHTHLTTQGRGRAEKFLDFSRLNDLEN